MVTGDDMMTVRLYNFPCLPGAQHSAYNGHHSHVMCVRLVKLGAGEDNLNSGRGAAAAGEKALPAVRYMCVSAGGLDKCLFVWEVVEA